MLLLRMKGTIIALMVVIVYTFLSAALKVDIFTDLVASLTFMETTKSEELILLGFSALLGLGIDLNRARLNEKRRRDIDAHRLRTMHATMATVHDIVNNFLNNLQLYRLQAERSKAFSPEVLKEFDEVVAQTAARLREIDSLKQITVQERIEGIPGLELPRGEPL
ncbi:hypothetical protein [Varunaivibrio sulfuroxidans]|uniref:Histidine kinase n=1 Tax=Varunaivibrio sulfuroxidans TaxID=1773489 RepID=A0A4V2UP34_9PROT|nr:hypothetical protein [Varunaivibrio sulfuroxidans]TCS64381.1 hypothetical protein EDD55_102427 [Varunaivibrio sulfuroxidans]WES31188.1 hypothetical protein P3M64_02070 [Varunaivibrio sulfuroxidans]